MKILVTGGAGYIGSHTAVELAAAGYDVFIIDNFSNSEPFIIDRIREITGKNIQFEKVDVANAEELQAFFNRNTDIKAAIHFAAYKAVGESKAEPIMYYRNNLVTLFNLLESCSSIGAEGVIFSSSATVYGQPEVLPVTEDAPLMPESPYGNTKKIAEEVMRDYAHAKGLKGICLRYFNPIGAHTSALIGELPRGVPNNLVPFVTQTAAGIREKLSVFGNDYATEDGTAIRDYIHVVDLAKAHVAALNRMVGGKQNDVFEIFNVGTGTGFSVMQVINTFERVNNLKLNYAIAPRRPGDVECYYADTKRANEVLGWKAELGLDDMLQSAWKWQLSLLTEAATKQ